MDLDGTVLEINTTIEKLIGYSKEDLIGENYMDFQLYPTKYLPIIMSRFKNIRDGEFLDALELEIRHKNGKLNWVNVITTLIQYGKKTLILSMIEDIAQRKDLEQKLRESDEIFKIFDEQSLVGVAIMQGDVFHYCNKQMSRTSGYSCEEIKNWGPREFLEFIHPEDRKFVSEQTQRKQIGSSNVVSNYILRGIKKDGNIIWVDLFSRTIQYKGSPGILITVLDISERKRAEDELNEVLRVKKDFINMASHEIKNPLTSISSAAQLLKLSYKDDLSEDALELVDMILKGVKRIDNIIHDLLDTTKIESDNLKLKKKAVDIGSVIISCIEESQLSINERNLELSSEIDPEVNLNVDKPKLEQVCSNLLSNAIKNTPPGGEIKVQLIKENNHVEFSISDTGIGLSEEDIGKLFKQFSRIDRSDVVSNIITEGTGLGLFISKEIVEKHEGQIIVESEGRNKGSKFIVLLPIK